MVRNRSPNGSVFLSEDLGLSPFVAVRGTERYQDCRALAPCSVSCEHTLVHLHVYNVIPCLFIITSIDRRGEVVGKVSSACGSRDALLVLSDWRMVTWIAPPWSNLVPKIYSKYDFLGFCSFRYETGTTSPGYRRVSPIFLQEASNVWS